MNAYKPMRTSTFPTNRQNPYTSSRFTENDFYSSGVGSSGLGYAGAVSNPYNSTYLNALSNINNRNLADINGNSPYSYTTSNYITNPYISSTNPTYFQPFPSKEFKSIQPIDELDLEFARMEAQQNPSFQHLHATQHRNDLDSDKFIDKLKSNRTRRPPPHSSMATAPNQEVNMDYMKSMHNMNTNLNGPPLAHPPISQPRNPNFSKINEQQQIALNTILAPRLNQSKLNRILKSSEVPMINRDEQQRRNIIDRPNQISNLYNSRQPVQAWPMPDPVYMLPMDPLIMKSDRSEYSNPSTNKKQQIYNMNANNANNSKQNANFDKTRQFLSDDEGDHFLLNDNGRLTKSRIATSLKTPNNQEYFYLLTKKNENGSEGYVDKFKDAKRRNRIEKIANAAVLKEYKRFKANAGFGSDFLDPSGVRETKEQKHDKMDKRMTYGNYVRDLNLQRSFTNKSQGYSNVTSLPNIRRTGTNQSNQHPAQVYSSYEQYTKLKKLNTL